MSVAAEIVAFLRELDATPPSDATALQARVGGRWRREERGPRVDYHATGTGLSWLAELELRTSPTLGGGLLLLNLAPDADVSPADVRLAVGLRVAALDSQPIVDPLPTPGSPPAAFEAWKRRSGTRYRLGSLDVAFSFEDERLVRVSTRLP